MVVAKSPMMARLGMCVASLGILPLPNLDGCLCPFRKHGFYAVSDLGKSVSKAVRFCHYCKIGVRYAFV